MKQFRRPFPACVAGRHLRLPDVAVPETTLNTAGTVAVATSWLSPLLPAVGYCVRHCLLPSANTYNSPSLEPAHLPRHPHPHTTPPSALTIIYPLKLPCQRPGTCCLFLATMRMIVRIILSKVGQPVPSRDQGWQGKTFRPFS